MSERTFTFKECYELLKINPKSFLEWLKRAGIDPSAQVDQYDPRKKFLTKSQLLLLAKAHSRILPPLDDDVEQPAVTVETLAEQVERLASQLSTFQQETTQRFDLVDRVLLDQIVPPVREITAKLQQVQTREASTTMIDQVLQHVDHLTQAIGSLQMIASPGQQRVIEATQTAQSEEIQSNEQPETPTLATMLPTSPSVSAVSKPLKKTTSSTKKTTSKSKKKPARGKKLPKDLVLLRDFAGQHHIAMNRASAAGKSGKIAVVQGKWLVNSRWATEALDASGQHDFYEAFHEHEHFSSCEQCPHALPQEAQAS